MRAGTNKRQGVLTVVNPTYHDDIYWGHLNVGYQPFNIHNPEFLLDLQFDGRPTDLALVAVLHRLYWGGQSWRILFASPNRWIFHCRLYVSNDFERV